MCIIEFARMVEVAGKRARNLEAHALGKRAFVSSSRPTTLNDVRAIIMPGILNDATRARDICEICGISTTFRKGAGNLRCSTALLFKSVFTRVIEGPSVPQ